MRNDVDKRFENYLPIRLHQPYNPENPEGSYGGNVVLEPYCYLDNKADIGESHYQEVKSVPL